MKPILFLFYFLLISNCQEEIDITKYEPQEQKIDTTIRKQPLELVETVKLEEDENVIISDILNCDLSPNTDRFIICDPTGHTAVQYDYKTGRIINFKRADISLTFELLRSGVKDYFFANKHYQFLDIDKYYGNTLNSAEKSFIKNMYFVPRYLDSNRIYIATEVRGYAIDYMNEKILGGNHTIFIYDRDFNLKDKIVMKNREISHPLPLLMLIDEQKNELILSTISANLQNNHFRFDSLSGISAFDTNGKFLRVISFLPESYLSSYIGYHYSSNPMICRLNNVINFAYPLDKSIYTENNRKLFDLYNLPFSNDSGFYLVRELRRPFYEKYMNKPIVTAKDSGQSHLKKIIEFSIKVKEQEFKKISIKTLEKLFPMRIVNIYPTGMNLIVWLYVIDKNEKSGYYYVLQEYSSDGKLLSQTNIYEGTDNKLRQILFDKINNYIVFFKKSKTGWTMEKRSWL